MALNRTDTSRWSWRSAVKGGLIGGVIAVVAPFTLIWYLSLSMEGGDGDALGVMAMVAILAAPVLFAFGAVGGVLAQAARGRPAAAPVDVQSADAQSFDVGATRLRHAGWLLAGALAGDAASAVTKFKWPITGGLLIGFALIPIWIWIGASLGHRVAVSRTAHRPLLGGVIAAGAASTVISTLLSHMWPGHYHPAVIAAVGSAPIGLFAHRRLQAERSQDRTPGASS